MRMPRLRFRLRTLVVAVAVLGLALALLLRPYPILLAGFENRIVINWSDGTQTTYHHSDTYPAGWENHGFWVRVNWSDGSWSLHLKRPSGSLRRTLPHP